MNTRRWAKWSGNKERFAGYLDEFFKVKELAKIIDGWEYHSHISRKHTVHKFHVTDITFQIQGKFQNLRIASDNYFTTVLSLLGDEATRKIWNNPRLDTLSSTSPHYASYFFRFRTRWRERCSVGCWHSGVRNAVAREMRSSRLIW